MTATSAPAVSYQAKSRKQARGALLVAAIVAAGTALFDLLTHPTTGIKLAGAADYAFTALLIPFVLAALVALTQLRRLHRGADGRAGRVGYWLACAGLLGFLPDAFITLATANSRAGGPLYPLSMLVSLAGLAVFAAAVFRARVLPRWAGLVLAVAWLLGGPVAEGGTPGFRGAALILAAAFSAVALTLPSDDSRD